VGTDTVLSIILGHRSGFADKNRKIDIARASLLAGVASQAREEFLIEDQFILKPQKRVFDYCPRGERWIIFGNRTYTSTFATLQAVIGLSFLNNVL